MFSSGNANPVRGMSAFTVITWLRGQAVKTSPFHGGNTGSIPVGVTFLILVGKIIPNLMSLDL